MIYTNKNYKDYFTENKGDKGKRLSQTAKEWIGAFCGVFSIGFLFFIAHILIYAIM